MALAKMSLRTHLKLMFYHARTLAPNYAQPTKITKAFNVKDVVEATKLK